MRIFEINAYSLNEAKEIAASQYGITIVRNVTVTYTKEKPESFEMFANDIFSKHKLTESSGVGCVVIKFPGSADTRERPYKYINNISEGQLKKHRVFEIRDTDDKLVAEAETKGEAARKAKQIMKDIKKDLCCKQVYRVDKDHEVAFTLQYTPSSNTTLGTYIIFGN